MTSSSTSRDSPRREESASARNGVNAQTSEPGSSHRILAPAFSSASPGLTSAAMSEACRGDLAGRVDLRSPSLEARRLTSGHGVKKAPEQKRGQDLKRKRMEAMALSVLAGIEKELQPHERDGTQPVRRRKVLATAAQMLLKEMEGRTARCGGAAVPSSAATIKAVEPICCVTATPAQLLRSDTEVEQQSTRSLMDGSPHSEKQKIKSIRPTPCRSANKDRHGSESLPSLSDTSSRASGSHGEQQSKQSRGLPGRWPVIFGVEMIPCPVVGL